MASSEGSREIAAAKKRLAAAKARASADTEALASAKEAAELANKMAEAANKNQADAQARLEASKNEAAEAKDFLEEAEERWKVYNADDSDDDEAEGEEEHSNKKQKTADETVRVEEDEVEEVVVEGCGNAKANGIYKRQSSTTFFHPKNSYVKEYQQNGQVWEFVIFRSAMFYTRGWFIRVTDPNGWMTRLYRNTESVDNNLPPKTGWEVCQDGTNPPPELKW